MYLDKYHIFLGHCGDKFLKKNGIGEATTDAKMVDARFLAKWNIMLPESKRINKPKGKLKIVNLARRLDKTVS